VNARPPCWALLSGAVACFDWHEWPVFGQYPPAGPCRIGPRDFLVESANVPNSQSQGNGPEGHSRVSRFSDAFVINRRGIPVRDESNAVDLPDGSKSRPAPTSAISLVGLAAPKIKAPHSGGLFCGEDDLWRINKGPIGNPGAYLIWACPVARTGNKWHLRSCPRMNFWQCNCFALNRSLVLSI